MRNLMVMSFLMIVICSAAEAHGGEKARNRESAQFANEVAAKIVYRSDANISVRANDCRLRIEYGALSAAIDLPLQGTTLAETDTEDGVILSNAQMTRTLKGGNPEAYEQFILRFERKHVKSMMNAFQNAIAACGGKKAVASAR